MAKETTINQQIRNTIEELGYEEESLTNYQKKHLIKIDSTINAMLINAKNATQAIKENKINKNTVSKLSGVSRPTIDKNKVLLDYIKHYSTEYDNITNVYESKDLRQQLNEAQDTIKKLVSHDVDIALKDDEIYDLHKQIENLRVQIDTLKEENSTLRRERDKAENDLKSLTKPNNMPLN